MIPFVLTISFVIHLILILVIILLSIRINRLHELEDKHKVFKKDIDELFSSYLMEMKEENDKFLNTINKIDQNKRKNINAAPVKGRLGIESTVRKQDVKESPPATLNKSPLKSNQEVKLNRPIQKVKEENEEQKTEYEPPQLNEQDSYVQSLEAQVLLLQKQGLTPQEIAQKLNRGKTEIELLLKFRNESS